MAVAARVKMADCHLQLATRTAEADELYQRVIESSGATVPLTQRKLGCLAQSGARTARPLEPGPGRRTGESWPLELGEPDTLPLLCPR